MLKKKISKKMALLLLSLVLVGVIGAGTTVAYFSTVTKQATNVFTLSGNIRASLSEPNWEETEALKLVPGKSVRKDPMVTNTCELEEYVALRVTFRYGENNCEDAACTDRDRAGEIMTKDDLMRLLNLLKIDWNSQWKLCSGTLERDSDEKVTDVSPSLVFYYEDLLATNQITNPVFENIRVKQPADGMTEWDLRWLQSLQAVDGVLVHDPEGIKQFHIQIEGGAVQASGFSSAAAAKDALTSLFPPLT